MTGALSERGVLAAVSVSAREKDAVCSSPRSESAQEAILGEARRALDATAVPSGEAARGQA